MKKIINPISTSVLEQEINKDTFVRKTNYCNHDIYIVDYHNHPNTTMEIVPIHKDDLFLNKENNHGLVEPKS